MALKRSKRVGPGDLLPIAIIPPGASAIVIGDPCRRHLLGVKSDFASADQWQRLSSREEQRAATIRFQASKPPSHVFFPFLIIIVASQVHLQLKLHNGPLLEVACSSTHVPIPHSFLRLRLVNNNVLLHPSPPTYLPTKPSRN